MVSLVLSQYSPLVHDIYLTIDLPLWILCFVTYKLFQMRIEMLSCLIFHLVLKHDLKMIITY